MSQEKQESKLKIKIYEKLKKVPKGKVITYKNLALACRSNASRFVGNCMATNLHPDTIPCYKVVHSDGKIGNYSAPGGSKSKVKKLENDGIEIVNGKVDLKKYGYKFR